MEKMMSQVQQLSLEQSRARTIAIAPLEKRLQEHEALLLAKLFSRNGREDIVQTATPPGYRYREYATPTVSLEASGPIMQIAAHPGDGPDFFYATFLQIASNSRDRNDYHELLLTDGEGGVDGWQPEHTRQVRMEEAAAGAELVGSRLHFLSYPDGSLPSLAERTRARLVTELAEMIGDIQPCLLVVHPPKQDHPDHAYSFLLTLAALQRHAQTGKRVPTLLTHDVEFGLQQQSLWPPDKLDPRIHFYPMHSPDLMVDISSTHRTAQRALHKHQTQMYDPIRRQPKAYADLIDTLAQVRGLQITQAGSTRVVQGQGFSHVVIPGITSEQNVLPLLLPTHSVYQRECC